MLAKTCTKCLKMMYLEYFSPRGRNKYASRCKKCCSLDKKYKYHKDIKTARAKSKIYRSRNKGKIKIQNRLSYLSNRKKRIEYQKAYAKRNRDKINARYRVWRRERYRKNIQFRLRSILCRRIHHFIKGQNDSVEKYIGCTRKELVRSIEDKFLKGMNWNNHGHTGWHIDHIKPIISFDLTKEEERYKAFGYKNLQPLWAIDNLKKGKK